MAIHPSPHGCLNIDKEMIRVRYSSPNTFLCLWGVGGKSPPLPSAGSSMATGRQLLHMGRHRGSSPVEGRSPPHVGKEIDFPVLGQDPTSSFCTGPDYALYYLCPRASYFISLGLCFYPG